MVFCAYGAVQKEGVRKRCTGCKIIAHAGCAEQVCSVHFYNAYILVCDSTGTERLIWMYLQTEVARVSKGVYGVPLLSWSDEVLFERKWI